MPSCSPAATSCIAREPLQLSDVTIQPVLFTLLFVYVFGSGVVLPGGGSYTDFAIAGLLALNLTTSAMGTAVGPAGPRRPVSCAQRYVRGAVLCADQMSPGSLRWSSDRTTCRSLRPA